MNDIDKWRVDTLRLISQGNPYLHSMAAARIIVQADICMCDDALRRDALIDVMETWIKTYKLLCIEMERSSIELFPQIVKALRELKGDAGEAGDDDEENDDEEQDDDDENADGNSNEDELPFDTPAPGQTKRRRMRPSHVPDPGPFSERELKCKLIEMEDDLRTLCFYGPFLRAKEPLPIIPLVVIGKHEIRGHGIRDLYQRGEIQRPWAGPGETTIDRAMTEDLIILFAAYEPWLSHRDREMRFVGLSPYLRNAPKDRVLGLGWLAAGALIERGVIKAAGDGRWSRGNVDEDAAKRLQEQWEDPYGISPKPQN